MPQIKALWEYWNDIFKVKEIYEKASNALTVVTALLGLIGFTMNFSPYVTYGSWIICLLFLGWAILWRPFKKHEAQKRAYEAEIKRRDDQIAEFQRQASCLALSFDESYQTDDDGTPPFNAGVYQVEVKNISTLRTANNVEVSVVEMSPNLAKDFMPSRLRIKRASIGYVHQYCKGALHPLHSQKFDIFKWDLSSNVFFCAENPHMPGLKLTAQSDAKCEFELRVGADNASSITARFRLKWDSVAVTCERIEFSSHCESKADRL